MEERDRQQYQQNSASW